jgi:putative ABC transport system permease protein
MDAMFGLSMNTIMFVLLVLVGIALSTVLWVFLRNRIIFMMGLRNIPRRTAQTTLIIIGLMLSTVIITAAFTTGDTVDYSITKQTYDLLGHADIVLDGETGGRQATSDDDANISGAEYEKFLEVADRDGIEGADGYAGMLLEFVPAINRDTSLSEPDVFLTGVDPERVEAFPDILDKGTGDLLNLDDLAPGEVFVNESAADELDARPGHVIDVYVHGEPHEFTVKAIVKDRGITGAIDTQSPEGIVMSLPDAHELFGHNDVTYVLVSAEGGVRDTLPRVPALESRVETLVEANGLGMEVSDTKVALVDEAEEVGNFMARFFLLLGLFSIGAGILLVVMIFVMLAAERKSEMGMARAVGTKRRHLIEMFLAEGMAYNLGAALVGVVLGILFAFGLALAASSTFSAFGITFSPHVTLRTVIISASLGMVLTFLTVSFSSWRVSNLNIVRAIRDIPEPTNRKMGWRGLTAWVFLVAFGVLMVFAGLSGNSAFPFALGFTLIFCGAAVLSTHFGAPARPAYTSMGLLLLLFWGLTAGDRLEPIFGELSGDIEMFFLSGVAMVTASTFVLIYNSDVFLALVARVGGLFGSILPALRTAIAYPMANRFRTGMTLAMISLVVFSLTMMSTMNLNYDKLFLNDEARGGWDIQVVENPNNPIPDLKALLHQANAPVADEIRAEGSVLLAGFGSATEVAQINADSDRQKLNYDDYPAQGLTDGFIDNGSVPLEKLARGYDDAAAVWEALRTEDDVAIIDGFVIQSGIGPSEVSIDGIAEGDDTFDSPVINVRDSASGENRDVRVIGVIAFGASSNFTGIFLGESAFREVFGEPEFAVHFVSLTDPDNAKDAARQMESTLVTSGAQADSLEELAAEENALSRGFLYLMQSFMGLGLLVGIAAVGVIAFRTVVERRQQIGVLRAIGYKRSTVALSFLLESSFVTFLGVASGILLGLWLAYFLVSGDDFPPSEQGFYIPWFQITAIGVFTVIASLLMTWIPSRQAAGVPTAEALRYE